MGLQNVTAGGVKASESTVKSGGRVAGELGCRYKTQATWCSAHRTVPLTRLVPGLPQPRQPGTRPALRERQLREDRDDRSTSVAFQDGRGATPPMITAHKVNSSLAASRLTSQYILKIMSLGIFASHDRPAKITR